MKTTTIPCPKCGHSLNVSDAIQSQIADELQKQKLEQSEVLRREYESLAEQKAQAAVQSALEKQKQQSETELEKVKIQLDLAEQKAKDAAELAGEKEKAKAERENAKLLSQIAAERESNQELQKKLTGLIDELNKATKDATLPSSRLKNSFLRGKMKSARMRRESQTKIASPKSVRRKRPSESSANSSPKQNSLLSRVHSSCKAKSWSLM